MAITSTQVKNSASVVQVAVGRYLDTGTVAAFNITTGFKPLYVKVMNNTSGDDLEWAHGMAAAAGHKRVAAGTASELTTLGITQLSYGFTVGLDLDINVTSEQLTWIAIG